MSNVIDLHHEDFWRGDFGTQYTHRNRVDIASRVPFWRNILETIGEETELVLEVGCNAGWNLRAIRYIDPGIRTYGVDVNEAALIEASEAGIDAVFNVPARDVGTIFNLNADMTFTAGVLIHIPPHDLRRVMQSIRDSSKRWVLAIEYEDEREVEVNYRGHTDKLWRRPYGKLYQDMGLTLVDMGPAPEFDNATYWLFEDLEA